MTSSAWPRLAVRWTLVVAVLAASVASVALIRRATVTLTIVALTSGHIVGGVGLCAVAWIIETVARAHGPTPSRKRHSHRSLALFLVVVAGALLATQNGPTRTQVGFLAGVLLAAGAEEYLFRVTIPDVCDTMLQGIRAPEIRTIAVALATQIAFALSHFASVNGFRIRYAFFSELVVLGCSLFTIRSVFGIRYAVATHFAYNSAALLLPGSVLFGTLRTLVLGLPSLVLIAVFGRHIAATVVVRQPETRP